MSYSSILEPAIIQLLMKERFYGELLLRMKKHVTRNIPTAGVNVTETVNLYVNPDFFGHLSLTGQVGILKHECAHVFNNHFSRFFELNPDLKENSKNKKITDIIKGQMEFNSCNRAADYAINSTIPELPQKFMIYDKKGEQIGEGRGLFVNDLKKELNNPDIKNDGTMEYYYSLLKQQQQDQTSGGNSGGDGDGKMLVDDHSIWAEGEQDEEVLKEKVKGIVNEAVEKAGGIGNLPGDVACAVERLNYKPRNWKQELRRFVARVLQSKTESSRKKRNRRYGILYPGFKITNDLTLAVAMDVSGSVSDEELSQFSAEIHKLYEMGVDITVFQCDSEIKDVYQYTSRLKTDIKGRGGTLARPVFDYIDKNKMKFDGLIYFTDGGIFDLGDIPKPKYKVLWSVLEEYCDHFEPNFGNTTWVKVDKK